MLHILGLSPVEQNLYETLVSHGPATHAELTALVSAGRTGRREQAEHTDTAPDSGSAPQTDAGPDTALEEAFDRLRRLCLLTEVHADPPRYSATPPHLALDALLATRLHNLARAHRRMLDLSTRFHHSPAGGEGLVEVLHGRAAIARRLATINAGIRHEVLSLDRPPYFSDPRQGNVLPNDQPRPDLSVRTVYHPLAMEYHGLEALHLAAQGAEQVRVGNVAVKLMLLDNRLAMMAVDQVTHPTEALLFVHDPHLIGVLRALFETYWKHAVHVHARPDDANDPDADPDADADARGPDPTGPPPNNTRTLLGFLASGLTNDAIAAQLGWSQRTVRRRVKDLMRELGAETRFQAGYQAVMRGWLGASEDFAAHDNRQRPFAAATPE